MEVGRTNECKHLPSPNLIRIVKMDGKPQHLSDDKFHLDLLLVYIIFIKVEFADSF
jgi:hypothetical protein